MMARTKIIGRLRRASKKDKSIVHHALRTTGVDDLSSERFYNLSGGQKQKVLIARALSIEPDFLVLDEPTADLDIKAEREILGLIKTLHVQRCLTITLVTHELNEVINSAQKFLFLNKTIPHRIFRKNELSSAFLSDVFETPIEMIKNDDKLTVL
jgi:ABC-type cobalamin/Fe3+-siderophores transport system ATPase subunit